MARYDPLERHVLGLDRTTEHTVSFAQVEQILGVPLPPSARAHQAWWANQRGAGHAQAQSWMGAGWHTGDLDIKSKRVTFRPVALAREPKLPGEPKLPALAQAAVRPLTIDEAKAGIAVHLGVRIANVEITIRV